MLVDDIDAVLHEDRLVLKQKALLQHQAEGTGIVKEEVKEETPTSSSGDNNDDKSTAPAGANIKMEPNQPGDSATGFHEEENKQVAIIEIDLTSDDDDASGEPVVHQTPSHVTAGTSQETPVTQETLGNQEDTDVVLASSKDEGNAPASTSINTSIKQDILGEPESQASVGGISAEEGSTLRHNSLIGINDSANRVDEEGQAPNKRRKLDVGSVDEDHEKLQNDDDLTRDTSISNGESLRVTAGEPPTASCNSTRDASLEQIEKEANCQRDAASNTIDDATTLVTDDMARKNEAFSRGECAPVEEFDAGVATAQSENGTSTSRHSRRKERPSPPPQETSRRPTIEAEDASSDSEQEFDIYGCSDAEKDRDPTDSSSDDELLGTTEYNSSEGEEDKESEEDEEDEDNMEDAEILQREPTIKVKIRDNDVPIAPATRTSEMPDEDYEYQPHLAGASKADEKIRQRIIKLLNMGFHEGSNENEAKKAMKLAQKLMRKHNLSQALLLQDRETMNEGSESLKGGLVAVTVKNRSSGKVSMWLRWFADLMAAIDKSFEVKSFYSAHRGRKCKITFYGIYTNCQLAAYAFKVSAERISAMQAGFVPPRLSDTTPRKAKLSYVMGMVAGILEEQEDEKDEEDETALVVFRKQNEKVQQDVLRKAKVKLGRDQQARANPDYDSRSYETGKKDAKYINLAQRAIRDDWNKKVKKEKGTAAS